MTPFFSVPVMFTRSPIFKFSESVDTPLGLTTEDVGFLICDKEPSLFTAPGVGVCFDGVFMLSLLICGIEDSRFIWGVDDSRVIFGIDVSRFMFGIEDSLFITGSCDFVKEFSLDIAPGVDMPDDLPLTASSLEAEDCPLGTTFDFDFEGVCRPLMAFNDPLAENALKNTIIPRAYVK